MVGLVERPIHQHDSRSSVSEVQRAVPDRLERGEGAGRRGRGRRGAPPRGGVGEQLRSSFRRKSEAGQPTCWQGAGDGRSLVSRTRETAESLPDGGARGSIDCVCRRILGARPQASWLGSRHRNGMAEPPETHVARARPGPRAPLRDTGPGVRAGASSRRERSPGEHRPDDLALARVRGRCANGLPGGAKLRSGRAGHLPASPA